MGVAKEHRGNAVIRRQADDQLSAMRPAIDRRLERDRIKDLCSEVEKLRNDLSRARRLIAVLRAEKLMARDELFRHRNQLSRIEEAMSAATSIPGKAIAAKLEIIRIREER